MIDWLREEGETAAAGEMLWGALGSLINALAEERGRRHISREKERRAFLRVLMDNGVLRNVDVRVFLFTSAKLHNHFYYGRTDEDIVMAGLGEVGSLIKRMLDARVQGE